MPRGTTARAESVLLRPADPFDLIRWLARSQSDPRKAVAELVQNSIDARARRILIERRRVRRSPALAIRDDGEGVLPELPREDALRTIATNIGTSRKRNLTPLERHAQVVAGKYGIGLLGFWSVGRRMDIRSRVHGSEVFVLRLREDEERAEIFRDRMAMDSESTFTEVVITEVHAAAARILSGRRLSEYLSAELRGPLLATGADVSIHDGLARGLAPKHFRVVPRRYTGEPLNLPATVEVPGYSAMRIELYFARGAERPAVELACAGTLVADDLGGLASLGLAEPPWLGRGLSGLIDFADFAVPPGTRRGVVPDAAAEAFARALGELAPLVSAELDRMDRERGAAANRQVMNDLRRAFRGLRNRLPQYELPAVEGEGEAAASRTSGILPLGESPGADPAEDPPGEGGDDGETGAGPALELFPPGPLAAVTITPAELAIAAGRERRVRAVATDDAGRALGAAPDLTFAWSANPDVLSIVGGGPRPALLAAATARPGMRETFQVLARQGERVATAGATATVVDPADVEAGGKLGIPEPELLDEPGAGWRSRFLGQRWQVNSGHEDFAALAGDAKSRLRYLLTLLAKEIVARTHGGPGADSALEGLVEILAHTERNLRGG
ncbi:MAG: ATP-binding protein [Deltaproteobacteria bacterium]|nr:ATP-binding protein [Deltaproteobacteria bacterium]